MDSPRPIILAFIRNFSAQHGYPPTYAEIAEGCRLSKTGVAYWINKMAAEGRLNKWAGRGRTVTVNEKSPG